MTRPAGPTAATRFAVAAAHGITERTVASWLPGLLRDPRVLVPIQLDALVVPSGDQRVWADCRMQAPPEASSDEQPADARSLLPSPFAVRDPRGPGVYLHWALPDALTRGVQVADPNSPNAPRSTSFPSIPDRWLVLRLSPDDKTGRRAVRGWVLEIEGSQPVVTDLDKWREPGRHADVRAPLTALGHGDPAWAAYFDNVENRLGFHDPLEDVPRGPVAYLVCGWYADPALDPLGSSQVKSLGQFDTQMRTLGWQLAAGELEESVKTNQHLVSVASQVGLATPLLRSTSTAITPPLPLTDPVAQSASQAVSSGDAPNYVTNGSWWPQQTLCHGAAVGLGWPDDQWPGNDNAELSTRAGGPPSADSVTLALASTSAEALGSVVAQTTGVPDDLRFVEAFTLDALGELDKPDGRAHLDARLHAAAFGSLPGGTTTEVIREPAVPPAPPLPTTPAQPGAGVFANRQSVSRFMPSVGVDFARELRQFAQPSAISVPIHQSALHLSETSVIAGGLREVLGTVGVGATPPGPPPHPARDVTVSRSLPRFFHPQDPVILLQGARRSLKHGGDGRFSASGALMCRLTGFAIRSLSVRLAAGQAATVNGQDLLTRGVENGSTPPECDELLREVVLLDPGSASAITTGQRASLPRATLLRNASVEQTVWWALRDPGLDPAPLVSHSGYTGQLPSPLAITPPQQPWVPLHLDWEVDVELSADGLRDWQLDEIDFTPVEGAAPPQVRTLRGRSLVTAGIAQAGADAARQALRSAAAAGGTGTLTGGLRTRFHSPIAQAATETVARVVSSIGLTNGIAHPAADTPLTQGEQSRLGSLAQLLDNMDVLSTTLDGLNEQLRNGAPSIPTPATPAPSSPPSGMVALRAGDMQLKALRLVDCFGQTLDLLQPTKPPLMGETMSVDGRPTIGLLPPRYTAPARLWFRWIDAETDAETGSADPVCGFVVPNHLDASLEVFDAAGTALGTVRPDERSGIAWEDAPGRPATLGQSLQLAVPNGPMRGLVQGLLDWGRTDTTVSDRELALDALLRVIDSTLWTIDPFGHTGEEHLSLLIGHPLVVMRALLRLEVRDPVNPPENAWTPVPVRLGALTHWSDGLLGFYVNDDYTNLQCALAAAQMAREVGPSRGFLGPIAQVPTYAAQVGSGLGDGQPFATPVTHPFVAASDLIWIRPNQNVRLTFLVEPHTSVNATTGFLPRKDIGMRREWIAAGLAALAPTFRFGPVLLDPKVVRMPVPRDVKGSWSWDHHTDVVGWADDPITNARGDPMLGPDPAVASEGWLKLNPPKAQEDPGRSV